MCKDTDRKYLNFNPRAHEGHDVSVLSKNLECNFNPRAHEGHDVTVTNSGVVATISIHVPTRGTTSRRSVK